jgi:phosphatidylinositol-3,4,5-trisphosphate 3-phosphatase/dual-specificity protein phosphatase PTEN
MSSKSLRSSGDRASKKSLNPLNAVRGLVSKKKRRYELDGFNLDLSYVPTGPNDDTNDEIPTHRIIAMGIPSEGAEGLYRNPLSEVKKFFSQYHAGHFKIYNLCSERAYDFGTFFEDDEHSQGERFGFDDHNPCPMVMFALCCQSMEAWLDADQNNIVAVHCKAGKGRTGTMIAAFLVWRGRAAKRAAGEALGAFAEARTHNGKGVTIPSQMRYVFYFERLLQMNPGRTLGELVIPEPVYRITHVRFVTVPQFDNALKGKGCDPFFVAVG